MNIAIVSPWAISKSSVGGTERFTIDLATQLKKQGNSVEVFTLSGSSSLIDGIRYTSLDLLGGYRVVNEYDLQTFAANDEGEGFYRKWAKYLETKIDVRKFDAIQLNSLLFIDAWQDKPRLFTIHTNPFEYELDWGKKRFNCVSKKLQDKLPAQTLLIAPSEHYAKSFSELFQRNVITVPHAIDLSRLSGGFKKHPKDATKLTVLLPSRIEFEQKRPQIVFQGISLLPISLRKTISIIASGKDLQYQDNCQKLEQIAGNSGFEAHFMKFESMSEAYAAADIVVLPSKSESFGYAALESLSLGIPTIMNSLPTFKEIGKGNQNAYYFKETPEAFADCFVKLAQDLRRSHISPEWSDRYDIGLWGKTYQKLAQKVTQV